MPTSVHVAVDGDGQSITPRPGAEGDRFFVLLAEAAPPRVRLTRGPTAELPPKAAVLIGSRITPELLRARPTLKTIIVPWAGIPRPLLAAIEASGREDLQVRNIHHNAPSAAETAVGLLLAAARGIPSLDADLRRHDWRQRYEPRVSLRLDGSKAVVLGRGAIGSRIGSALIGLGMTVEALGRPPRGDRWASDELATRVKDATALLIAVPAGPETDGVVDARVLDAMPGGIVVNVGRGSVLDEDAVHARLADGRLFAAGIDVWWQVPADEDARANTPPSRHSFHELDNVVMTPHVGGGLGEAGIEAARAHAIGVILAELRPE